MPPLVSVIVPVLADVEAAAALLRSVRADSRAELIVVDGGENDGLTAALASRPDVQVVRARSGRATQMNAGAARASGEWLLFLHADSRLPADWLDVFATRTRHGRGGWFLLALDDPAWQARAIEWGVRWRVRLLRLAYGDQGLFVRRQVFADMGGYRDLPLMEDVEFVRRLVDGGGIVELPIAVTTSARRWQRDGWFRRSARNVTLLTLYFAGVAPARLLRWYSR